LAQLPLAQLPLAQQPSNRPSFHTLSITILKLFFYACTLIIFTPRCVFASDNTTNIPQLLCFPHQDPNTTQQIRLTDQQTFSPTPTTEQKDPLRTLETAQQSYAHALIASAALGGLNTLSCLLLERHLPLWWPINVIAARISCSLLLPSIIYAYLAFAEGHGITCHSSTMQTSAFITDWVTYLAIKKYNLL